MPVDDAGLAARPAELTLTNWDLGGTVSNWSYRHADVLFPTETLTPGTVVDEVDLPTTAGIPAELEPDIESGLLSVITVLAGGRPVFRWRDDVSGTGLGGRQLLMSVSKVFASLAIGLLVDRGDLDYDRSVRDYLPELGVQWQPCALEHVLDMTSGVGCPEVGDPGAYSDPGHPFFQFEASLGWRPATSSTTPYDLLLGYDRSGTPGSSYEYTSVNTFLLAWIIERIAGERYPRALQHLIWDRLALAQPAAICVNHDGTAISYGGLIMTVDDLARFGTLFTPSQPAVRHDLRVPAGYLAMLQAPRDLQLPGSEQPGVHPGGQWNLIYPDGDLFKSGFGGQGLYVSPVNDVVIAYGGIPDANGQTHQLRQKCRDLVSVFAAQV